MAGSGMLKHMSFTSTDIPVIGVGDFLELASPCPKLLYVKLSEKAFVQSNGIYIGLLPLLQLTVA